MNTILTILHIIVGLFLIVIVLLQSGKGASMGATFGGSSQTLFGSRGAGSFLSKITTASAVIFMITSLSLATISSKKAHKTIMDSAVSDVKETAELNTSNSEEKGTTEKSDKKEAGESDVKKDDKVKEGNKE